MSDGVIAATRRDRHCDVAFRSDKGAVDGDARDLVIGLDMIEKVWQEQRVANIANGELRSTGFEVFPINSLCGLCAKWTGQGSLACVQSSRLHPSP